RAPERVRAGVPVELDRHGGPAGAGAGLRPDLPGRDAMEAVMVVEVLSGHHRVRTRYRFAEVGGEARCTVGRSVACDVVLDDPFVAAVHARVSVDAEGRVTVTDLESINGLE